MKKKTKFLRDCDNTKFAKWPIKKRVVSTSISEFINSIRKKVDKRKMKAKSRKSRKKGENLTNTAREALEKNFVINLSSQAIPINSIAAIL